MGGEFLSDAKGIIISCAWVVEYDKNALYLKQIPMKILAIGAHHDDVELGCGGTLLAWKKAGHKLSIFTASSSGYRNPRGRIVRSSREASAEAERAARFLGAKLIRGPFRTLDIEFCGRLNSILRKTVEELVPDVVFTHWHHDSHHDHRAVALATLHCCRHVPRILAYASNWYAGEDDFAPRFFIDIGPFIQRKLDLIAVYRSEAARTGGTWAEFVTSSARLTGLKAGVDFAEGFEVIKWRM